MRTLLLIIGPPIIVALAYSLTLQGRDKPHALRLTIADTQDAPAPQAYVAPKDDLTLACQRQALAVQQKINGEHNLIVRPPYVIAGDFSSDELERYHSLLVAPTQRALVTDYFDQAPTAPVSLLLFATDKGFEEFARQTDQRSANGEYGYYHRGDRRIVINAATGNGTLAHELTHALAHFDFPNIPAWFDEGLAALHEGSEFSEDALHLRGLSNWRLHVLCQAIEQSQLNSIEALIAKETFAADHADIDYAHARYLCLYLQTRGLLAPFYRKFRRSVETDPTGVETLRRLLQVDTLAETNLEFQSWALSLNPSAKPAE